MSPSRRRRPAAGLEYGSVTNRLLGRGIALIESALGPEAASAYGNVLGLVAGAEAEEYYRKRWDLWERLIPAKYGYMIVDIYERMGAAAFLTTVGEEKVTVGAGRCPFGNVLHSSSSLCLLMDSLFGGIAVRNFGYAKVVHRRQPAAGGGYCETTVYLTRSTESEAEEGREYHTEEGAVDRHPAGMGGVIQRMGLPEMELREKLQGKAAEAARLAEIETAEETESLKEAISVRETFTSAAFHELLNALAQLKALAQLSNRALQTGQPEGVVRAERNLEAMSQHVDLLAGLIRDMSDAFSIVTARLDLQRERINLNSLVAEVAGRFSGICGEHSIHRLKTELPRVQLIGLVDRTRTEQVLTNLLANAVTYSPKGGLLTVKLELTESDEGGTEKREGVGADPRSGAGMAVVTVRDQGIGIPPAEQSTIFNPFTKAGEASRSERGAGLGLHICKGIVEAHGGRIWVDSQVGLGSTFRFSLPVEEIRRD